MDAPPFTYDFFLSRRGSVAAVAQEVADVLEAEGYRVLVQDYDFAAGGQFVRDIDDALKQARDLLILSRPNRPGGLRSRPDGQPPAASRTPVRGAIFRSVCVHARLPLAGRSPGLRFRRSGRDRCAPRPQP